MKYSRKQGKGKLTDSFKLSFSLDCGPAGRSEYQSPQELYEL